MMAEEIPVYKRVFSLEEFINATHDSYIFLREKQTRIFIRLDQINQLMGNFIVAIQGEKNTFLAFFLLRAHSAFLSGCSLSTSGQLPDSYSSMRAVLENAIYSFFLWRNPSLQELWLSRNASTKTKKELRKKINIREILKILKASDPDNGTIWETLYERTIDYGAHPNAYALFRTMSITEIETSTVYQLKYINMDEPSLTLALKTLSQCGIIALRIFYKIWKPSLMKTDIGKKIDELAIGL